MTDAHVGESFTGQQVCDIAGISYRQLDYWDRTHLLEPSVQPACGSGTRRVYSISDMRCAVALSALSEGLRGGGVSILGRVEPCTTVACRRLPAAAVG